MADENDATKQQDHASQPAEVNAPQFATHTGTEDSKPPTETTKAEDAQEPAPPITEDPQPSPAVETQPEEPQPATAETKTEAPQLSSATEAKAEDAQTTAANAEAEESKPAEETPAAEGETTEKPAEAPAEGEKPAEAAKENGDAKADGEKVNKNVKDQQPGQMCCTVL